MANYYVKTTGTRTTGESTADDWTDSNCYNASNFTGIAEANLDTFVFDAGVYNLTAQWSASSGISFLERGNGLVEINPAAVTYGLQFSGGAGQTVTIGSGIQINKGSATTAQLYFADRASAYNIDIGDIILKDGGPFYGLLLGAKRGDFTAEKLTFSGDFAKYCINTTTELAGNGNQTITIEHLNFDSVVAQSGTSLYGFRTYKANAANTLGITINAITGSIDGTANNIPCIGVSIDGGTNVIINEPQLTVTAPSGRGISIIGSAGTGTNQHIIWASVKSVLGTGYINFNCPAGDALEFGVDAIADAVVDHEAYGLTLTGINNETGSPHGLTNRNLSKGVNHSNWIRRFHSPLMHSECTDDAVLSYGNLVTDCYGVGLSYKGNSGGIMANNTVVIAPTSFGGSLVAYGIWCREQTSANSASQAINNNIIFLGVAKENMFVMVDTLDALTLSANNYFTDQSLPAAAWSYTGTGYTTLAAWNAAQETVDATEKQNFAGTPAEIISASGNVALSKLLESTQTYGGGIKWWTGPNPETLGEPLSDNDTAQGIQSTSSPNHPANL
jgi:hypothetical protein